MLERAEEIQENVEKKVIEEIQNRTGNNFAEGQSLDANKLNISFQRSGTMMPKPKQ